MSYLSNTILKYPRRIVDGYSVPDYQRLDMNAIKIFLRSMPDAIFKYYSVQNNDKFERIAQEIYGNPDYWDIIMLVNDRNPLFDLPFDHDTIMNLADDKITTYEITHLKKTLSVATRAIADDIFVKEFEKRSDRRVIKYVTPEAMNSFLQAAHDQGIF